MPVALNHCSIA